GLAHGGAGLGIALERAGDGEDGAGQLAPGEHAMESPKADSAAVLEHALGAEVAALHARGRALGQAGLRHRIAVGHGLLAAFLVVDDEVDRDVRAARPPGIGRVAPVAHEVADAAGLFIGHWCFLPGRDLIANRSDLLYGWRMTDIRRIDPGPRL